MEHIPRNYWVIFKCRGIFKGRDLVAISPLTFFSSIHLCFMNIFVCKVYVYVCYCFMWYFVWLKSTKEVSIKLHNVRSNSNIRGTNIDDQYSSMINIHLQVFAFHRFTRCCMLISFFIFLLKTIFCNNV